jgi:predicted aspartyl protease
MIMPIRYGGQIEIEKNGKKQTIALAPRIALSMRGAFLEVMITHPTPVRDLLKQQGKEAQGVIVGAVIDTGASTSVISPSVADKLGLVHTGYQKVSSVQDEQEQPVYYGRINFQWGKGKDIPIVACPLRGIDCLIGRDILMHWYLVYSGVEGSIVICD